MKFTARKLVLTAIMGTIAYLLMMFKFPLPFMPPFMDFDLAGVPEMIGTFLLGPISGLLIVLIKLLIKLTTVGTTSMFTGEIQNFLLSASFILPSWFFYQRSHKKQQAFMGMVVGTLSAIVVACVSNIYFIIPFYATLYGLSMEAVVAMTQAVNPFVDSVWKLVVIGIVPFNLIKFGVCSGIVYLSLDRLRSIFLRREFS
ncbi:MULTISPECIES: ECF transporter S component [Enterococcus]|uniref:Riboflavin transporter n=1 Tax=Candidatus Enterococcus ferrettii TaxID=2815324 RepID=A0ABV0EPR5_9ENTE|nr:ECF transporter S component [Enterococcus sp. 665A]MBO1342575.1 ECF transporter S component [Enterococcus sp. 665A]